MGKLTSVLVIILSPLYIIRTQLIFPTTLLEILLITCVILTIIDFARQGFDWRSLKTNFDYLIAFLLVAALIATFKSYDLIGGLGIFKAYFLEPILFFYCLRFHSKKSGPNFIYISLLISGIWLSLLGVIQKITGSFTLAPYEIAQGRVSAVYNSANSLALYLGPIIILSLGLFFLSVRKYLKFSYLLLFILFTIIMIWTRSRGGLIAQFGATLIFIYILLALKNKVLRNYLKVIPIICAGLIILFLYAFYLNYNFLPSDKADTLQIRYLIWAGTINMLKDHPFFGAGLNGFKSLYQSQYHLPQLKEQFQYPHNLILTFWAETGLLGLAAFLSILVGAYGLVIRTIAKPKTPIFSATLIAMLSYWVIHGMVDVPYFKNDLSLEFWVVLALIEAFSKPKVDR